MPIIEGLIKEHIQSALENLYDGGPQEKGTALIIRQYWGKKTDSWSQVAAAVAEGSRSISAKDLCPMEANSKIFYESYNKAVKNHELNIEKMTSGSSNIFIGASNYNDHNNDTLKKECLAKKARLTNILERQLKKESIQKICSSLTLNSKYRQKLSILFLDLGASGGADTDLFANSLAQGWHKAKKAWLELLSYFDDEIEKILMLNDERYISSVIALLFLNKQLIEQSAGGAKCNIQLSTGMLALLNEIQNN